MEVAELETIINSHDSSGEAVNKIYEALEHNNSVDSTYKEILEVIVRDILKEE